MLFVDDRLYLHFALIISKYAGIHPNSQNHAQHVSYIFKLVCKNGDFLKKSGSRHSVNLLFEHQFACQGPPPENVTNFKPFNLGGYWDSEGRPHHSSDVKSCGESISDRITGVGALYLLISGRFIETSVFLENLHQSLVSRASLKM